MTHRQRRQGPWHADALAEALDVFHGRAASRPRPPSTRRGRLQCGAAGALFSGNLVEDLMRPWRSAALSLEAAALEWPPGPSTTHSPSSTARSRPALLRLALERRDAASSAERVRKAHANVRRGLSNLLEGALEPDPPSLAHPARASDGLLSSSFTLEEARRRVARPAAAGPARDDRSPRPHWYGRRPRGAAQRVCRRRQTPTTHRFPLRTAAAAAVAAAATWLRSRPW